MTIANKYRIAAKGSLQDLQDTIHKMIKLASYLTTLQEGCAMWKM